MATFETDIKVYDNYGVFIQLNAQNCIEYNYIAFHKSDLNSIHLKIRERFGHTSKIKSRINTTVVNRQIMVIRYPRRKKRYKPKHGSLASKSIQRHVSEVPHIK